MLYVGLDLSRKRIDFHALREDGELVERGALPADPDGLARLVYRLGGHDREVLAVIESMNGARFVPDTLERYGRDVEIADAQKVKGLAPLACNVPRQGSGIASRSNSARPLAPNRSETGQGCPCAIRVACTRFLSAVR